MYRKRKQLMELAVCIIDAGAVLFSLWLTGMSRYHEIESLMQAENMKELCSLMLVVHIAAYYFTKIYDGFFKRGRYSELIMSIKYNLVLVAGAMLLGFSMKNVVFVSRLVMGYFFVINTLLICLLHIFIRNKDRIFHWSKHRETNLLVVTTRDQFQEIQQRFRKSKECIWNIMGVVLLDEGEKPEAINGIKVIDDTEDAYLEYATLHVVDEVFIQLDAIHSLEN